MIFVYLLCACFICLYLLHTYATKKITFSPTPILVFFFLFILVLLTSTIFSTDRHLSIFGYYTRLNGSLLSTACYLIIFFTTSSMLSRKDVIDGLKFLILSALIVSIWGIPGHFGTDPNCFILVGKLTSTCWREEFQPTLRIFSTLGQPNWLGAYLAMVIPISLSFIVATNGFQKLFFTLSTLIIFLGLIFTNSRSAFLALFVSLIVFFTFLGIKKLKSNLVPLTFTVLFMTMLLAIFGKPLWERNLEAIRENIFFLKNQSDFAVKPQPDLAAKNSKPPASTSLESGGTESGQIRLIVWQGALGIFKNYPILGSGPETFATVYYRFRPSAHNQTTEWNFLYNKAHNEYLNYLSNTGLVGLIAYLLVIISIVTLSFKRIFSRNRLNRNFSVGILSSAISYLSVNFFGFSVVVTSLIFFLLGAILIGLDDKPKHTLKIPKFFIKKLPRSIPVAAVFILFLLMFVTVSRIFLADIYYNRYQKELGRQRNTKALQYAQTALATSPYFEPLYAAEVGYAASLVAENSFDTQKDSFIKLAQDSIEASLKNSPNNLSLWRKAQSSYFELSLSDSRFLEAAENAGIVTTNLAPTDPAAYYNLALIQKTMGKTQNARNSFGIALKLKPDYVEAQDQLNSLDLSN